MKNKILLAIFLECSAYIILFMLNWKIAIVIFLLHWAYNILRDIRNGKWDNN